MISRIKILLGTILIAVSFGLIIIPNNYCSAGVTGFAKAICNILPLSLSVCVLILNTILLIISLMMLGLEFTLNTLAVSILFPLFLDFFSRIHININRLPSPISCIIAGLLLGLGVTMILNSNGSSGGFDIIGLILNKKLGIQIPIVMTICDTTTIILQAITQPAILPIIYGLTVILISNLFIKVLTTNNETRVASCAS